MHKNTIWIIKDEEEEYAWSAECMYENIKVYLKTTDARI
jgi:hypothetical protein